MQYRAAKQEATAEGRSVAAQREIVVGKVVALRIFERQFDMLQMGIIRHRHRQTRAGKVALFIELR